MDLMNDEHVRLRLTPHPMRQIREYPLWVWILLISVLSWHQPSMMFFYLDKIFETGVYVNTIYYYLISIHHLLPYYLLILVPAFLQALLRLEWRPFFAFSVASAALAAFCHNVMPLVDLSYQLGIWISLLMLCHKEYQRVSTQYILTNHRLVLNHQGRGQTVRSLFLSNIQDVILQTSIVGNFLDYGTVVPLTASGIGTGQSTSTAALQTGLGGRFRLGLGAAQSEGKTTANASPEYALVCIPKARQAYKMILEGSDSQKPLGS